MERLRDIERYVVHLEDLRPRVGAAEDLADDLSLHNDVIHSLLMIAQMVVDVCGELSARHKLSFADYASAVRNLERLDYPPHLVSQLARLPGFRNIVIHEYAILDYDRVLEALDRLDTIREFIRLVRERELPD